MKHLSRSFAVPLAGLLWAGFWSHTAVATDTVATIQPVVPVPSEEASAQRHFFLTGFADVNYQKREAENGSFALSHFNSILLFRAASNVLAEGEMEMEVNEAGETELALEYAQIDYVLSNYITFIAGRFVLPIGVVREKLDAQWINKLPMLPVPEADNTAMIPENDIGVQVRGAVGLGDRSAVTYALYGVNGPGDVVAGTQPGFNGGADNNGHPSGGGRLGWFCPWSANHDVEIGVSGQTGTYDVDNKLLWSVLAVDGALHMTPNFEARGEFLQTWQDTTSSGSFQRKGWWGQLAYKATGLNLDWPLINSVEAVFRIGGEKLPDGHLDEYDIGLTYYISNTSMFKGAYSIAKSNLHDFVNPDGDMLDLDGNQFRLQAVCGF
jgi:hypothetical protein